MAVRTRPVGRRPAASPPLRIDVRPVRSTFDVGSDAEACVADDDLGRLYVNEADEALWRYGAEPGDGTSRRAVDTTGDGGHLTADVEGLTIVDLPGGTGYLLASSQGDDSYTVYRREDGNAFVRKFEVDSGPAADGCGNDGRVFAFGDARHAGDVSARLAAGVEAVDLEPKAGGDGYWIVDGRGSVSAFGQARHFGDFLRSTLRPGEQVVSLSATPTARGYWVFTSLGRVSAFGDAGRYGDMAGTRLNAPVLDSIATPSGRGYFMVAGDGGIFSFGDARFHGSADTSKHDPGGDLVPPHVPPRAPPSPLAGGSHPRGPLGLWAAPASATVTGGCQGAGTINGTRHDAAALDPDSPITIPEEADVAYEGSVPLPPGTTRPSCPGRHRRSVLRHLREP